MRSTGSWLIRCAGLAALAAACASAAGAPASAEAADARRARAAVDAGRYVPLEDIISDARQRHPGRIVEVELDEDDDEYEIEILTPDGRKIELEYDARSGRLLEEELDD
ncbi:MAG: PepSY domain-containing protein [Pseudomonadales bacterium]